MSRDIKDYGDLRNNVSMDSSSVPAQAMPSDRQYAREFIGALLRLAQRDIGLLVEGSNISDRSADAAEIAEFGLLNREVALEYAQKSSEAEKVDPRAFGSIRRFYRSSGDISQLGRAYMREMKAARTTSDEAMATLGTLQAALRRNMKPAEALKVIEKLKPTLADLPEDIQEIWSLIAEDVYVLAGQPVDAALLRRERFSKLTERAPEDFASHSTLALQTAALTHAAGSPEEDVLSWLDVSFKAAPSPDGARPLIRRAWRDQQLGYIDRTLQLLAGASDDVDVVSSALYQLGMLYAWRLGALPQAMQALSDAMASGASAGVAAIAFISLARAQGENAFPDEFAGALSQRVECAASSMERADLLTQMAERFDADLALADSAVELAETALVEYPSWTPALRLLGTIYARDGRWEKLVELHMRQLEFERDPDERRRLHERIAEIAQDRLRDVERAESHLLAALDHGWRSATSRRLLQIYRETNRGIELVGHLLACARSAQIRSEKLRFYEEAAVVYETRLHDAVRAIDVWTESLGVEPNFTTALSALERLYFSMNRWEDLLGLRAHELALTPENEVGARTALMCSCGEIAVRRLANPALAEEWYVRALTLDPLCDDALRGLGTIFKEQNRWEDLIAMTERELERSGTPERRARCLRLIGETYSRQLNQLPGAALAYRRLGQLGSEWHEEALIWLERVYEAQNDAEKRIAALKGRRKLVSQESDERVPVWTSRLSFRIAEALEWNQRRPEQAIPEYLDSLSDPKLVVEAIHAIDRCLATADLKPEERHEAVDGLREKLDGLEPAAFRAAMEVLLSEARRSRDGELINQLQIMMTEIWVADPSVIEPAALRALAQGDFPQAELLRSKVYEAAEEGVSGVALSQVDRLREVWRRLDTENFVATDAILMGLPSCLSSWLARDAGLVQGFDGSVEREQLDLIRQGAVSLSELISDDPSWISRNLSVMSARAMHDRRRLAELLEYVARQGEEPVLEMRLWLDASSEPLIDAETRRRWLRQASALGNYEHPLREELYRALQASGDIEGLAQSLVEHVYSGTVSGDSLANLALRAARALEHLQKISDALELLRLATISAPSNGEIACEKSRIELFTNDLEAARETLEQALSSGCADERRFDVVTRLGELHLRDGGDRDRAIELLEDAWANHGQRREVGLTLAQAHLSYGQPARCAEVLETLLTTPVAEDDIRYWITLGRTHAERLDDVERGESILWSVFEAWSDRNDALQALHDIAIRKERLVVYANRFERTLQSLETIRQERRAELWMMLGETQFEELQRYEAAEYAFQSALDAGAPPSVATIRRAEAISKQGRKDVAANLFVESVQYGDFDLRKLGEVAEKLDIHFSHTKDHSRARTIRQLRHAMGADVPDLGPSQRRPAREAVNPELIWRSVDVDAAWARERTILADIAPLAARLAKQEKTRLDLEKYNPELVRDFHEPWLHMQTYLGLEGVRFSVAPNARGTIWLDSELFALPSARVMDPNPSAVRFHAAWVAGMAFSKLAPFSTMNDVKIRDLIASIAASLGLPYEGDPTIYASEVQTSFAANLTGSAKAIKRAQMAIQSAPDIALLGGEGRLQRIFGTADRIAAAFTDHAGTSLREVLRVSGAIQDTQFSIHGEALHQNERARHLFTWMMSDSYRQLRETFGIGQRSVELR